MKNNLIFAIVTVAALNLAFGALFCNAQTNTYDKWEKRILSNTSFAKVRSSIEKDTFKVFYNRKEIPTSLIDTLIQWNKEFSLANPKEKFSSTDFITDSQLPRRQIIMIIKSKNNVFITYKHGGRGFHHHILWADIEGDKVNDIWIGVSYEKMDTINNIKKVLSEKPEDLNTNMVCF